MPWLLLIPSYRFGAGAYLLCLGIGFQAPVGKMLAIMSSMMISEVVGFLAVVTPAGLGIREGTMYLVLKDLSSGGLPLLLPFAAGIVNMLVDVYFGAMGLVLLKTSCDPGKSGKESK